MTNSWAEMRRGTCVFACKGCREMARLVGEVEDLRQMTESMKRIVTGQEERRGIGGPSGRTGRIGEVRRSGDTRQHFNRRKLECGGGSGTQFIRR